MSPGSRLRSVVLPLRGGDDGGAPLPERAWRTTVIGLHVVFVLMLALAAATTQIGMVEGSPAVALATLGVLALAYLLLGAPAIADSHPVRAVAYLTVLVAVFAVLERQAPDLLFLLFLAYPQVWFLVESPRPGVFWTLALALASTAGSAVAWAQGHESLSRVLESSVGMVFSLALGIWFSRVMEQSRQRATLIRELETTRAELAAAHREQGIAAERERLAREVHDTLAQGYTSIVVLAQAATGQLLADPGGAAERLGLIEEVARENLAEARAMVAAFAPVPLQSATLVEALQRLAERFGRETGVAARLDTSALGEGPALRRDEEVVLLRGAQEALTNVRRHAAASAVVIRLSRVGEGAARQVSVHVEDDGIGFDPSSARGAGLEGLRSRVAQVGGSVDVVSAPGAGTRVTLRVRGA